MSGPRLRTVNKMDELEYNSMFNDKVYSMIKTGKTSELIEEYEKIRKK